MMSKPEQATRQWWHTATVYQIYPASFKDSNGDGYGDLEGVISKVPYIASLGVDAVWLSPCYKSPYVDMGYDISDYRDIDPRFGSIKDIERLIAALGQHDMKLIMDLVVNHTSDQHPWFLESKSSVQSSKRDWYIWRKPKTVHHSDGTRTTKPPNNWESQFKGSAWKFDESTGEYYLHIFATEQPDLNWNCPEVRKAVYDDMKFWLDKGVAGFRMDVINFISKPMSKDLDIPDAPITKSISQFQPAEKLYTNGPRVHEYLQEMHREVLGKYSDIISIGEAPETQDPAEIRRYVEPHRKELQMLFQFDLNAIDVGTGGKFSSSNFQLKDFKSTICKWQTSLSFSSGAWQTVFLESHDLARSVNRFGDKASGNRFKAAKVLCMLEITLSGTLFMHQGQEIGMANLSEDIPIEEYMDIETKGFLHELRRIRQANNPDRVVELSEVIQEVADEVRLKARDHGRTPMPWNGNKPYAGFTDGDKTPPWSPMNSDVDLCNVERQDKSADSVLEYWRQMIKFRKANAETLIFGDFKPVLVDNGPLFAYHRTPISNTDVPASRMLIVLNLTKKDDVGFQMPVDPAGDSVEYTLACSRSESSCEETRKVYESGEMLKLKAFEGFIFSY